MSQNLPYREPPVIVDTAYSIATPEGVEIRLPVAGLAVRSLAWLLDAMIKAIGILVIGIVLSLLGAAGAGLYLVTLFVALWFYNIVFELLRNGATPGKAIMGIRVVNSNGTPVSLGASVLRNLLRAVDMLPGTYAFGCLSVLMSDQFQRLGDLAAGTLVVYTGGDAAHAYRPSGSAAAINVPLAADERQAIMAFAERAPLLSPERQRELTAILEPVLGSLSVERLSAHANWLAGREQP